jgi:hypothetical protein
MRKQYLHLSAYACEKCNGPVISGSLAVRENEISRPTEIRHVGAICLACSHRQNEASESRRVRHFSPTEWDSAGIKEAGHLVSATVKALHPAELHGARFTGGQVIV